MRTNSRTWAPRCSAPSLEDQRYGRDGTTTATVLAQAIVREGAKSVAAGMSPMDLKRGVEMAVAATIEDLKKRSSKIKSSVEISQLEQFQPTETRKLAR